MNPGYVDGSYALMMQEADSAQEAKELWVLIQKSTWLPLCTGVACVGLACLASDCVGLAALQVALWPRCPAS